MGYVHSSLGYTVILKSVENRQTEISELAIITLSHTHIHSISRNNRDVYEEYVRRGQDSMTVCLQSSDVASLRNRIAALSRH